MARGKRAVLLDEALAAGLTVEAAAEFAGVHIRTAYRHKADADRARRRAAQLVARDALGPTVAALAAAIENGAAAGTNTTADYRAYYLAVRAAHQAAYGSAGSPGEHSERTARMVAHEALATDVARSLMTALYLIIDAAWTAQTAVGLAEAASRAAWAGAELDNAAAERLHTASREAADAAFTAFGDYWRSRSVDSAISAEAISDVAPYLDAAMTAARSLASDNSGDLGLDRAAAAYAAYDDGARAAHDAAYDSNDDDAMDAAFAARAAIAPYAAYVAWIAAAEAVRILAVSIHTPVARGAEPPST